MNQAFFDNVRPSLERLKGKFEKSALGMKNELHEISQDDELGWRTLGYALWGIEKLGAASFNLVLGAVNNAFEIYHKSHEIYERLQHARDHGQEWNLSPYYYWTGDPAYIEKIRDPETGDTGNIISLDPGKYSKIAVTTDDQPTLER
jgi:hypothetical protein